MICTLESNKFQTDIFTLSKLWRTTARHNLERVKIYYNRRMKDKSWEEIDYTKHVSNRGFCCRKIKLGIETVAR